MTDSRKPVIAIDGPAGAGKSTVAKIVAQKLCLFYLDTGAMYRAVALKAWREGVPLNDASRLERIASSIKIEFSGARGQVILMDGEDVSKEIRAPSISEASSKISTFAGLRSLLVAMQQRLIEKGGAVLEGRDATTVIAPGADVKIFLTASLEERSKRRRGELVEKGSAASFEMVRSEVEARDHRDITRSESPLQVAVGALVIESGGKTPDQIADEIVALLGSASSPVA